MSRWRVRPTHRARPESGGRGSSARAARIFVGALAGLQLLAESALAATCTEIESHGVRFELDGSYTCGHFVTGDPWVVPNEPGGKVTITEMTPSAYGAACDPTGHHGWEVNPAVGSRQALDDRISGTNYDEGRMPCLPYAASPGDSILKTVSWNVASATSSWRPADTTSSTALDRAAVLTVLAGPPPADAFRPPYAGPDKPIYRLSQLDLSRLPKLAPVEHMPSMAEVRAIFNGPWLDHIVQWPGRQIHPAKNMRNRHDPSNPADYGAEIGRAIGEAVLRSLHGENDAEKLEIVVPVVQYGIDLFHQLQQGAYWRARGGHGHGRKLPILFAGKLLGDERMLAIGQSHRTRGECGMVFSEDGQTYYGQDGVALWGEAEEVCGCEGSYGGNPDYDGWLANGCKRDPGNRHQTCRDPAGLRDGGGAELFDTCRPLNTLDWQRQNGVAESAGYQFCCSSATFIGTQMAALLLDLKEAWNHDAFFDYVDRWMEPPWNGGGYYGSPYFNAMHDAYRACAPNCPGQEPAPRLSPPTLLDD